MDAPAVRGCGAENVITALHPERHKSTGAATVLAVPAGTIRAPARRAAFGDVTNLTKNVVGARDEAKAVVKPVQPAAVAATHQAPPLASVNKENLAYSGGGGGSGNKNTKKRDTILRPAQRSAHLAGKHNILAAEHRKQPASALAPNVEGGLAARADLAAGAARHIAADEAVKPASIHVPSQALLEGLLLQPRHHKSQPQLKPQQPTLRRTQSKQLDGVDTAAAIAARTGPALSGLPWCSIEPLAEYAPSHLGQLYATAAADGVDRDEDKAYGDVAAKRTDPGHDARKAQVPGRDGQTAALSEPEDCWDEIEEDEEDDQDQAYTTAHSFRTRDLTAGGVTTLLAPRMTARVQRELDEAKLEMQRTRSLDDIEEELWDVSMVAEYGEEIFEYMRELEVKMLPNPYYMEMQTEIQWSMRSVLMDWLVQVHNRFSLLPETLFLTVNYIDRFLSCKVVSIGKLQLVGATAILVASKYEEINCPSLGEIVYMVDGGYSLEEILKAERFMLSMLSFELGWPGPMSFLRRVSKADDYDLDTRTLAKYFLELTIMDERFVASPPSFLAAGAHCLSRLVLKKGEWTKLHVHYSGYTWDQLKALVTMMMECCESPRMHHSAVYEKYKDRRFKEASTLVQRALDAGFTLLHQPMPVRRAAARSAGADDGSAPQPYANGLLVSTGGAQSRLTVTAEAILVGHDVQAGY